jgi:Sulfatase
MNLSQHQGKRPIVFGLIALFVLNSLLSMTNLWPTPFVHLDGRLSAEFIFLWSGLLALTIVGLRLKPWHVTLLSGVYFVLVLGRYFDTTAPALFGRAINLYWDTLQIPRLLWVLAQRHPWWITALVGGALVLGMVALFALIRWALRVTVESAAAAATRPWSWWVTGALVAVGVANFAGVQATWPYISRPVIPTYIEQVKVLTASILEGTGSTVLPASPPFVSDLKLLEGADFNLFFLESYGAIAYDNEQIHKTLTPSREALEAAAKEQGLEMLSAFVTSTTFAGGTDLAHMAFLTGIDTRDPLRHDVLLTTNRPTVVKHFGSRGYETIGFYPGLSWEWSEGAFFGYDKLIDARNLEYRGPELGYWKIPDQVALARFAQRFPVAASQRPRFLLFGSTSSHMPFHPVPPYQPDWKRALTDTPYDADVVAKLQASKTDWLDMRPGYVGMLDYNYQWLRGYLQGIKHRESVWLLIGDHQPVSSVTGPNASWDVPVHFLSAKPEITKRLLALGFTRGMQPARKPIAGLAELSPLVLNAMHSTDLKAGKTP